MNDIISLADESGEIKLYQVDCIEIIDSQTQQINSNAKNIEPNTNTTAELILITCYPFNALSAGGSLRYVIKARPLK
jgi:sortase A